MSAQFYLNLSKLGRQSLSLARLGNGTLQKSPTSVFNCPVVASQQQCAYISTSKKNRETIAPSITSTPATTKVEEEVVEKKKYWQSQGFSHDSEEEDLLIRNRIMFWTTTVGLVLVSFIFLYSPDYKFREWSTREAYIELARREALGLPLVDPDLVPKERIVLPSEEELGDFEIII